jgi:beta-glucosidase
METFKKSHKLPLWFLVKRPYAEMEGDVDDLYYGRRFEKDLALLKSYKAQGIPVVSVFLSGRPLWVHPEINASDAFCCRFSSW